MKLGFLTAPFPQTPLMDVADWAAASGFEVLEIACWPPRRRARRGAMRARATSTSRTSRAARPPRSSASSPPGPRDLRPRLLPEPAPPRPGAPGAGHRPPPDVIRRREQDGGPARQHVHGRRLARRTQDENWEVALARLAGHRPVRAGPGRADHDRELPDDLQRTTSGRAATTSPRRPACGAGSWSSGADTIGLNFDPSHLVWQMIDTGAVPRASSGRTSSTSRPRT